MTMAGLAESVLVLKQRLSTSSVPAAQRAAYWREVVCGAYAQLECSADDEQGLVAEIEVSRMGRIDFTHLRSNANRVRRTADGIRADCGDSMLLLIQKEGQGALRQGGRVALTSPGDCVLNDCSRPYEFDFSGPVHGAYVLRFDRRLLAGQVSNFEDLCATTIPASDPAGHLLATMAQSLQVHLGTLSPRASGGISNALMSVVSAALAGLSSVAAGPMRLRAYHLLRIRQHVRENLRDPDLTLASVAQAVQLSPDHIRRIFRTEAMSLSRTIWHERLELCKRELEDPLHARRSVSDIAFSAGFSDPAHFSREFRRRFGETPREWRAMHGG